MDPNSHKLHHGGIAISDWFSDKLKEVKHDKMLHKSLYSPPTMYFKIINY
jgi:hypothetical protein